MRSLHQVTGREEVEEVARCTKLNFHVAKLLIVLGLLALVGQPGLDHVALAAPPLTVPQPHPASPVVVSQHPAPTSTVTPSAASTSAIQPRGPQTPLQGSTPNLFSTPVPAPPRPVTTPAAPHPATPAPA